MKDFLHLHRLDDPDEKTRSLSTLTLYRGGKAVYTCRALELPWKDNQRGVSCIPLGLYPVRHYQSATRGHILAVDNVPGRQLIRVHPGNYTKDTEGCILPGTAFGDADGDGHRDVLNSRVAMNALLDLVPTGGCSLLVTADKLWND